MATMTAVADNGTPVGMHTVYVDGYGPVVVELDELGRAEARIRNAAPNQREAVIASLPRDLAALAIFDMSHLSEQVEPGEPEVLPIPRPCYEEFNCDNAVPDPAGNEPPADPPPTNVPVPPPAPTCYAREDARTGKFGIFFKSTAYKFHQRVTYCVVGQIIQPGFGVSAWYSDVNWLWDCKTDQFNPFSTASTVGANLLHALSTGKCVYALQLNGDVESAVGNARPSINDTYGVDGNRVTRSGSSY